jgi:hypothetical protein
MLLRNGKKYLNDIVETKEETEELKKQKTLKSVYNCCEKVCFIPFNLKGGHNHKDVITHWTRNHHKITKLENKDVITHWKLEHKDVITHWNRKLDHHKDRKCKIKYK